MITKELISVGAGEADGINIEVLHFKPDEVKLSILMVPSLGRPAQDFDLLAHHLYNLGHQVIVFQPPGHGASEFPRVLVSLQEFARYTDCIRASIAVNQKIHLIGHAFGNRQVRCYASDYHQHAGSVILIACGGIVSAHLDIQKKLLQCFDGLPPAEHNALVKEIFFAKDNVPTEHWQNNWNSFTAYYQGEALKKSDVLDWWTAGDAPILCIQPVEDIIAVKANAIALVDSVGSRCKIVELQNAGHAALPEQADALNLIITDWLKQYV